MRKVTIVGAGLVGCLWAVLLRKRGYEVTVFERRPDIRARAEDGGRSINLVITSRGLHGLELAGLRERALALSVPVYGRRIHPRAGDSVFQPYGRENECNHSISRAGLNRFLLDEAEKAGAVFRFEHPLAEIDSERKVLRFGHGRTHAYDLLFGTDGAGSRVRHELVRLSHGAITERTEWLDADYKELELPAGPGGKHLLEKNALHIWPRGSHMMMALANLDGSFTLTLYLPKSGTPFSFEAIRGPGEVEALFRSEFASAIPLVPSYQEQFARHPRGELGTVRCSRWTDGSSIALLGDAAHAIVPFFGQGMNAGFEDCTTLLSTLDRCQGNWARALAEFDRVQRPNAEAIADMAIENWVEMRDKVGDPRFQLRKKVEGLLEKEFPRIYKSRYGMITYTLVPYGLAREAGRIQERVLERLCQGISRPEECPLELAQALLKAELEPFLDDHQVDLRPYQP